MEKIKINDIVLHKLYGRGFILSIDSDQVQINFTIFGIKRFKLVKSLEEGELFLMNENQKFSIHKNCRTEFKEYKTFINILNNIHSDDKMFIDLYKQYNNKYIYKWLLYDVGNILIRSKHSSFHTISQKDKNKLLMLLSIISYRSYDGELWNSIKLEFEEIYKLYDHSIKLEQKIRYMIDENDKYETNRQITNPLVHSGVPKYFLSKFFDFVFDIYLINLNAELNDYTVDEIIRETIKGIVRTFDIKDDTIHFKITSKTYTLIQSTKLALKFYPKEMAKLIVEIIKIIDAWYHNRREFLITDRDLREVFTLWQKDEYNIDLKKKRAKGIESVPRATLFFDIRNKNVVLKLPGIPIRDESNKPDITVNFYNGKMKKELIFKEDYFLIDKIGLKELKVKDIILNKPLDEVRVEIIKNNEIIYSTREQLNRKYILFNQEGKEIYNNRKYEGNVFIVIKESDIFTENNIIKRNINSKVIAFQTIDDKVYLINENERILFTDLQEPGLYGDIVEDIHIKKNNIKTNIKLYKNIESLVFESNKKLNDLYIEVNNLKLQLTKDNTITGIDKTTNNYRYTILFNNIKLSKYENNIRIKDSSNNLITSFRIFYDKEFSKELINTRDLMYQLIINSSYLKEKNIEIDFSKERFYTEQIKVGKDLFTYVIEPNIFRIKNLEEDLYSNIQEVEDISKELIITKEYDKAEVIFRDKSFYDNIQIKKDDFDTYINLSSLRSLIKDNNYVDLYLYKNENIDIVRVYLKETMIGSPNLNIENDEYIIGFNIKAFKKNKLNYEVKYRGVRIYYGKMLNPNIKITSKDLFFGLSIKIFIEEDFFSLQSNEVIYEGESFFTDSKLLEGKEYQITRLTYFGYNGDLVNEKIVRPAQTMIKFVKKLDKDYELSKYNNIEIANDAYEIKLFKINRNGIVIPFLMKERIYAEVSSPRFQNTILLYIEDQDGEALGFNSRYNFIDEFNSGNFDIVENIVINLRTEESK